MKHSLISHLLCFTILTIHFQLVAQKVEINGRITDTDGTPIHYANVVVINQSKGTATNQQGEFRLMAEPSDSLRVSHIAFEARVLTASDAANGSVILNGKQAQVAEVAVYASRKSKKTLKIGYHGLGRNGSYKLSPGSQLAALVTNPKRLPAHIRTIHFELDEVGSCQCDIRVRILTVTDENNSPGKDILLENVVLKSKMLKKLNSIDIAKHLVFAPPNGVFVVVEWISDDGSCKDGKFPVVRGNINLEKNYTWFNYRDIRWNQNNRPLPISGGRARFMTPNVYLTVGY